MDCLLTPEQKALRQAIRDFVVLEASENAEVLVYKLGDFLKQRAGHSDTDGSVRLSGVETAMVLEEALRCLPGLGPEPLSGRIFEGLSLEVRCSAASLGSAQGLLAPCLERDLFPGRDEASGYDHKGFDQELADVLSAIEAARLMTYRAALLEDKKRPNAAESIEARRRAEELASRASVLAALVKEGRKHET